MPLPSNIGGVTGSKNIAELWKKYYRDIFNCFNKGEFNIGDVSNTGDVIIRPVELCYATEKLAVNKADGLDQKTAEHVCMLAIKSLCYLL